MRNALAYLLCLIFHRPWHREAEYDRTPDGCQFTIYGECRRCGSVWIGERDEHV